jgi:hypothetical protein
VSRLRSFGAKRGTLSHRERYPSNKPRSPAVAASPRRNRRLATAPILAPFSPAIQTRTTSDLSLTRAATVLLGRGQRAVIGVGRVKTPTLATVCRRELEIRAFRPQAYFEVGAIARSNGSLSPASHLEPTPPACRTVTFTRIRAGVAPG